ncbi:MAG: hypothetical protein QOE45_1687 [Frankiaceae bacterium]|jgi:hypothetical protein|nr:hypothetical protein [Frankiaceae bacterium]
MRRLLAVSVLSLAALGLGTPAHAAVKCAGVYAGGTGAGACAGTYCPDACFLEAYPTCYSQELGFECVFTPLH